MGEMPTLPESLIVHENVHRLQQGDDIEGWWDKYIEDVDFRLDQEIPAHCAEYQYMADNYNRYIRRRSIKLIASRISGPLYNRMIKFNDAKQIILKSTRIRAALA